MMTISRRDLGRFAVSALAALPIVAASGAAMAGDVVFTSWGKAIRGYDPVAYFTEGRPVEGDGSFESEYMGATWRFANAANKAAFDANPEKYAPQFGGFCAWAVSQGYTASIDPDAWDIVDGKLYLNYSKGVQTTWRQDRPGNIRKGEANWPGIKASL